MSKYIEFTGKINSGSFSQHNAHFIIEGESGEHRLFEIVGGRERGEELMNESDIERHKRYDLEMDTNMVFTVHESGQYIVSWRWKIMRQMSELVRFVVDQTRKSEYENGGFQKATVWLRGQAKEHTAFEIDDNITDEVYQGILAHPNVESVDRNGGWFTITARF